MNRPVTTQANRPKLIDLQPIKSILQRCKTPSKERERSGDEAPPIIYEVLQSTGQPLDPATRAFMEPRFGHDFSQVRIHADATAAESARAVSALAYTVGHDIAFDVARYSPRTLEGRCLLAHELTHVVQQHEGPHPALQRQQHVGQAAPSAATPTANTPRQDYVFIMGEDEPHSKNQFYSNALRYYRAHLPGAIFIANVRNLAELLDYIQVNVHQPIGNLYIVSHANEEGTLLFGLNRADENARLTVSELRSALHPAGGVTALASVNNRVDARTRIHIKGCDIGRTQEMVELLDETFGGAGTVIAPTHEQIYGFDPSLAHAEERRIRTEHMAAYMETLPPLPSKPAPLDPTLRGSAQRAAQAERHTAFKARRQAIRERQKEVATEERRIAPEVALAGEKAGTYEALSGPMFQHPGTALFTAAELQPEVQRLYPQLSVAKKDSLVRRLIKRDGRPEAKVKKDGLKGQQGQRIYRWQFSPFRFVEPRTLAEANRAFASDLKRMHFKAKALRPAKRQAVDGGTRLTFEVEGRTMPPHGQAYDDMYVWTADLVVPTDADLITQGQTVLPNPARYAWRVEQRHATSGMTTLMVVAERVVAYLHYGSLDPSAKEHFIRPESDPAFFSTSTFWPRPVPPPTGGTP